MPSVPVPVFTLAILLMLLAKVSLSGSDCYRRATMFLAGCALLLLLAALRWSFDFQALRQLQSLVAVILPPLAWRCLHERPRPQPLRQNLMLYAPAVAALSVNLVFPAAADVALAALYLGYGTALLRTSRRGSDAFSQSRLSDAPMAARLAFGAGAFLCFSGLTDIAIAIDFSLFSGQQAPMLVAASQIVLLPFICFAIVLPVRKRAQPAPVAVSNLSEKTSDVVQDAQRCAQLEETLRARSLYLNPDLTLDLLARKTGKRVSESDAALSAAARRYSTGLIPTILENSRLKFDLVLKPDASITSVTGEAVWRNSCCACAMRKLLIHCETLQPRVALTAREI